MKNLSREEALEIAKANAKAHCKASIEHLFRNAPAPDDKKFGHSNGWYIVGTFSFNWEEIRGEKWDYVPGGWAYV